MWICKKQYKELKNEVAALEEEQLRIREMIKNNMEQNQELIEIVKKLRLDLGIMAIDASFTK